MGRREAYTLIGSIERSADFERVLAMPNQAKSKHFVLHYLGGEPSFASKSSTSMRRYSGLPASPERGQSEFVPEGGLVAHCSSQGTLWLGLVVPKRHAKRSVTRSLLKRQMREAVIKQQQQQLAPLKEGLWVIRLRAAFEISLFKSAASKTLSKAVGDELRDLLTVAVRRRGLEH